MLGNLSAWTWITIAWAQLVIAYGGYLAYLAWRARRAEAGDEGR